mgnify:CR=1 FL=1
MGPLVIFILCRTQRTRSTGWGGLFIFTPWAGLIATVIGVPLVFYSRYVSLGSIVGATAGAVSLIAFAVTGIVDRDFMWYGVVGVPMVIIRHHDNILRLIRGQERKLGAKAESSTDSRDTKLGHVDNQDT